MNRYLLPAATLWLAAPAFAQPYALPDGTPVAPLEAFQVCAVCPEMVVLPLGRFTMGAPLEQSAFIWSLWNKPRPGVEPGMRDEGPEARMIGIVHVLRSSKVNSRVAFIAVRGRTVDRVTSSISTFSNKYKVFALAPQAVRWKAQSNQPGRRAFRACEWPQIAGASSAHAEDEASSLC